MTFCEKLHASLFEEYKDVVKYNELAVVAANKYKPILRDIAKEEWKHSEHIKKMLDDVGETMTKEELTAHDEAHNSLNGGV